MYVVFSPKYYFKVFFTFKFRIITHYSKPVQKAFVKPKNYLENRLFTKNLQKNLVDFIFADVQNFLNYTYTFKL